MDNRVHTSELLDVPSHMGSQCYRSPGTGEHVLPSINLPWRDGKLS